jgi:hypothetical protein
VAEWHRYNHLDKSTAPRPDQIVWVHEMFYANGETSIGAFDGFTFRVAPGWSDDAHVTHWAVMERPAPPAYSEIQEWDAELDRLEEAAHPDWYKKGDSDG